MHSATSTWLNPRFSPGVLTVLDLVCDARFAETASCASNDNGMSCKRESHVVVLSTSVSLMWDRNRERENVFTEEYT
jgi:hypothetical protein